MFKYRLVQSILSFALKICLRERKVHKQFVTDQSEIKVHSSIILSNYEIEDILVPCPKYFLVPFSSTRTSKFFKVGGM